jgi:hypothetical protein
MRRTISCFCAVILMVGGYAMVARAADEKTVEGELVDMKCFAKSGAKGEGHMGCAKKCMAEGNPAGILVDGKAWTIATDSKQLADYASKTIRVTGMVNTDAQTVVPSKIEVKEGDNWKEVKIEEAHKM